MTTSISWCNETWNWLVGCSRISPGCVHCYAADVAKSARLQQFPQYQKVKEWNGTVEFVESQLLKPLKWQSPKKIFTCSMSDVFHESVPFEWIDKAFAVMAIAKHHTFQVLTKRPKRMKEYLSDAGGRRLRHREQEIEQEISWLYDDLPENMLNKIDDDWVHSQIQNLTWPLPNVWLGVSVENQKVADERIPLLLQTPAAIRFLSCEPLLEEIDISQWLGKFWHCPECEYDWKEAGAMAKYKQRLCGICGDAIIKAGIGIGWCIAGGESGSKARECHVDWLRSLVQQCQAAEIPVFVKQLGSNALASNNYIDGVAKTHHKLKLKNKGSDLSQFPEDLKIQKFPHS